MTHSSTISSLSLLFDARKQFLSSIFVWFFRLLQKIPAALYPAACSDPTSYICSLTRHLPLLWFAQIFHAFWNSSYSPKYVLRRYRIDGGDVCIEGTALRNCQHVQPLLHLNRFRCFDVHICRTANFFFAFNLRLPTQHMSSIEKNELRLRFSITV